MRGYQGRLEGRSDLLSPLFEYFGSLAIPQFEHLPARGGIQQAIVSQFMGFKE
jgi:hypothetical protein